MIATLFKKILTRILRARGYSGYFAPMIAGEICTDLFKGAKIGIRRRWWGYRRGFLGDTVSYYGLTPETYRAYMPDFQYYHLHPLNEGWSKWVDDKLTMRYILAPFAEYLPKYYFHLRGKEICRLMDCPSDMSADAVGLQQLLQREKRLGVKIVEGSGGIGFYKLEWSEGAALINGRKATGKEFGQFVSGCTNHIVTEYLTPHPDLGKIYPHTANTVRVWILRETGRSAHIGGAFIRFGTVKSGAVDNVSAGGICAGVRVADGALFRPCREERTRVIDLTVHPDTKVPVEATVPHWVLIKEKVLEICAYLPQLRYLGFDIVSTDEGFKILEINSHQSPMVQLHQPFLQDSDCRRFFLGALKERGIKIDQA